jgi:hypothetical protein
MSYTRKSRVTRLNPNFELLTLNQFSKLAMTYWVGGALTIASIIIPLLFKVLDEITAAVIVGQILNLNAYCGMVALLFALLEALVKHKLAIFTLRKFWYLMLMSALIIINYFAVFPLLSKLRTNLADIANHIMRHSSVFNFWHSISSWILIALCLLGALYIIEPPG